MSVPNQRPLRNYLRATNLEVGLLLHFGPTAQFFREYFPKTREGGLERRSDKSESSG